MAKEHENETGYRSESSTSPMLSVHWAIGLILGSFWEMATGKFYPWQNLDDAFSVKRASGGLLFRISAYLTRRNLNRTFIRKV